MHPFSLHGKTILITGGTGGIGISIAQKSAEQGARIILLGRDEKKLKNVKSTLPQEVTHETWELDLLSPELESQLKEKLDAYDGTIDGFVHAAGISPALPLNTIKKDKVVETMQINTYSAIEIARQLTRKKHIPESGQSIVFISSVMATVGEPAKSLYGMSKGALLSASKSLALELAPKKIRVNCISPAVVLTPMSLSSPYSKSPESMQQMENKHPLGFGRPEDIAYACIYLLSEASRWVSGTDLVVDGGYSAK